MSNPEALIAEVCYNIKNSYVFYSIILILIIIITILHMNSNIE